MPRTASKASTTTTAGPSSSNLHSKAPDSSNSPISARVHPSDPSYGLWRRTSLRVTNWLVHQLSSDFLSRLVAFKRTQANSRPQTSSSSRFPPNFADTMWTTIRRVALHQIPGEQAQSCEVAYLRCIHANRVGYLLARTSVNDFWYHVYLSNLLDCTITPYCAALLLLRGLRHDLKRLGDLKLARLEEEGAPREYSWKEFDALCGVLVERLLAEERAREGLDVQMGRLTVDGDAK